MPLDEAIKDADPHFTARLRQRLQCKWRVCGEVVESGVCETVLTVYWLAR
jgi:hypothetical protein